MVLTVLFCRKRSAGPSKLTALSVALPFSFIDYHRKHSGHDVSPNCRSAEHYKVSVGGPGGQQVRVARPAMEPGGHAQVLFQTAELNNTESTAYSG